MKNLFTNEEQARYARHFNLPEIGETGQLKLCQARVLCVGSGGLGSPALLYLAAAGIGTLGIIDDDTVSLSNLQRQILYDIAQINQAKVTAAKQRLQALNPNVEVIAHCERLHHDNAQDLIADYDLVIDGSDNHSTRYIINDACFYQQKPMIYAAVLRFTGYCSVFHTPQTPCYRCLFAAPPAPQTMPSCSEAGVLGVLPGILGILQATEAIKLILNLGEPLAGRLLIMNTLTMRFREVALEFDTDCLLCHHQTAYDDLPYHQVEVCAMPNVPEISVQELKDKMDNQENFCLLDVREEHEYATCNLQGQLIPLRQLLQRLDEINRQHPIIVHCHKGGRSSQAVQLLLQAGFKDVYNLAGGIAAWAEEIDTDMPKY